MIRALLMFMVIGVLTMASLCPALVTPLTKEQLAWHTVKVAAVQMNGNWNWHADKFRPDSGEQVIAYVEQATADGAQMVVFPELLLGMFKVPSPTTNRIAQAAAKHKIYVIAGCFEILDEQGNYANSTLVFGRDGKIIGRYFKMHPALGEAPFGWPPMPKDPEWMMVDGTELPVFDLDFGRIGIFTCYDGYFPETYRTLALKGAEILIWVNARNGSIEDFIVKSATAQNYAHMICTNKAIGAGTMIAHWPTNILAVTTETGDQYISAELQMDNLRLARKYSREFFQRAPEKYKELTRDYQIWQYYENIDNMPELPEPAHLAAIEKSAARPGTIKLTPLVINRQEPRHPDMHDGQELGRLAFTFSAPWFDGSIELRLPEILQTDLGMHFMDHYMSTIQMVDEVDPMPQWRRAAETDGLAYDCVTAQGLHFGAVVTPGYDEIDLMFYIENHTGTKFDFAFGNPCLDFAGSPAFDEVFNLSNIFACYDGEFQDLTGTTPTPAEKGRDPWLLMLTEKGVGTFDGPKDTEVTWWLVDQVAEENLMAMKSRDGKFLVGYTWDTPAPHMMTNCGNPCLHTGPGAVTDLADGARHQWYGKIYVMRNNPDEVLKRYHQDQKIWQERRANESD